MSIKVVGFRVLVKKDEVTEETTDGGIVLPDIDRQLRRVRTNTGVVVGVGDVAYKAYSDDYTGERWATVGDRVIWAEHSDKVILDPDTKEIFSVVNDDDIIAVVTDGR